ncbi:MAG: hypothetical protein A2W26_00630 [Acidobacteria bacterium RBG_16_64_8]|nr:MAG: hypothetical protein A2W26_00630 [Acidobacteria bacterium RBG_16_64_8]
MEGWFRRGLTVRGGGATLTSGITASAGDFTPSAGGVDLPLSTAASTGTDLVAYGHHLMLTSSDGGYYMMDPPSVPGRTMSFIRLQTTASTSYLVPDATGVTFWTSSGSSEGRLVTISGHGSVTFLAVSTSVWAVLQKTGNVAMSSST